MDRNTINTIVGILLIFAILMGYSLLTAPSKEELEKRKKYQDSIYQVQKQKYINDSIAKASDSIGRAKKDSAAIMDSIIKNNPLLQPLPSTDFVLDSNKNLKNIYGKFYLAAKGNNKHIILESDLLKIKISSKGGGISYVELKQYKTHDKKPLILFDTDSSNINVILQSEYKFINSSGLFFEAFMNNNKLTGNDSLYVKDNDSLKIAMRLFPADTSGKKDEKKYLEFEYTLYGNNYMMGFNIHLINMQDVIDVNSTYFAFDWKLDLRQQEKSHSNEMMNTTVYFKPAEDKVDYLKENKDDKKEKLPNLKWISFKQQFFAATMVSKSSFKEATLEVFQRKDTLFPGYLKTMSASLTFEYTKADKLSYPMSLYFGPTKYKTLRSYKLDLERQVPIGWGFFLLQWINRFAVIPVFDLLSQTGMNYGIIILILTILLKIVLLPIAYKTYMSSARMRVLKPEVDEISQKYPKKEDALKKQQAIMALYKKAGINPMAGCVPLLLQMPILIAMYRFFPASIELRQQSFLWATDLSTYDSIWTFPNGFSIPFYGDHVSLFTLLMTISTIIYTKLNNQMMGTQSQPGMKFIMYAMPIMFLGFFNNLAAGLSYYYLLANLITFLQMFLFRKFVNEEKIRARIQENKKKPVKVSGFQKRLEEMAKKRGYPIKR